MKVDDSNRTRTIVPMRVLILSASAGTGHVRCGDALEKAFGAEPRVERVAHEDALRFTNKLFRDFYSKLYLQLIRDAPSVLGWVYRATDEPWKGETARVQLDRLNTRPLVKFIGEFAPDAVVCTHFMPAGIIGHLIERGDLQTHLSLVVTDLDCHAMWLSRVFHRYFVAIEETKAHLEALGLPGERVSVTGIPIDAAFSAPVDPAEVRKRLGLRADRRTVLLSAGALGVGPTEIVVRRLLELPPDIQAIVICGRSGELQTRIRHLAAPAAARFTVLGYSDRMHELMRSADLFIGKPGGLTTSEALACGLPMCVVSPIPGQEERNSDHLLEDGAAIRVNELTTLPWKISRLLADPARLARMRQSALALGRPHAARDVARTLLADHLPPVLLDEAQRKAMTEAAVGEV
jgi:processive 1,2-diacylglycerol beta-glucosyltransferase